MYLIHANTKNQHEIIEKALFQRLRQIQKDLLWYVSYTAKYPDAGIAIHASIPELENERCEIRRMLGHRNSPMIHASAGFFTRR